MLTSCTTPPPPNLDAWMPEGIYHFRAEFINQNDPARITHRSGTIAVELLGDLPGGFSLAPQPDGKVIIVDANIDYPGLKRSFKGEGRVSQPGTASGTAVSWLKSTGPISRNHRKGPWTLRPFTAQEIRNFERKQADLQQRRERARAAE